MAALYTTTPLIEAVRANNVGECRRLIESEGADTHKKDSLSDSPLMYGSRKGYLDIVELLLSKGADIHDTNNHGWSPIILASFYGHVNIVEFLLSKGANVYYKSSEGYSPTLIASAFGRVSVVDLLLSKGASLHDTTNSGRTCFSFAHDPDHNPDPDRKHGLLYRLRKWPTTMAILVLTELGLIYRIDSESLVDLHQYIGREDLTRDVEESHVK